MFQQQNSTQGGPEGQTSWSPLERKREALVGRDSLGEGPGSQRDLRGCGEQGWEFGPRGRGEQLKGLSRGGCDRVCVRGSLWGTALQKVGCARLV